MKRYGYEPHPDENYFIFDRLAGCTVMIAEVYDVADAEMIVDALNNAHSLHHITLAPCYCSSVWASGELVS
jgi:hypothetical protein